MTPSIGTRIATAERYSNRKSCHLEGFLNAQPTTTERLNDLFSTGIHSSTVVDSGRCTVKVDQMIENVQSTSPGLGWSRQVYDLAMAHQLYG